MTTKTNQTIREAAKEKGVALWQIADKLGIQDSNFSKKLRHELNKEEADKIMNIIAELAKGEI